jgi:hypothetical protein
MGAVERPGKHAAPRHAASPTRPPAQPARIDAARLDPGLDPGLDPRPGSGFAGSGAGTSAGAPILGLALGITAAVVAWGYLVYLAIDFGTAARDGDTTGWWMLALATVGAIACLFVGMLLGSRFVQRLRGSGPPAPVRPPRTPGGRRAAR